VEITINNLARMACCEIANKGVFIKNIDGPTGVNARKSNNELIETVLGWKPKVSLREGMERTFTWIESEMKKNG
jgi:GDP-D-mannose 3', 5'-epimerase